MNYFISDTHFGHVNVLKFDKRPFKNIDEMNNTIINNWNNKVNDDDHIWILGDFCYRSANPPEYYLSQLRGHKHLLIGNHDKTVLNSKSAISMFDSIQKLQHIKDGKHNIILCHFPLAESILQVLCKYKIVQKNLFKWTELNSVRFYVIRKISNCQ